MAEFATFITDPDLETRVIRAIKQSGGVVAIRGVSNQQIAQIDPSLKLTLLSNGKPIFINADMVVCVEEINGINNKEKFAMVHTLMGESFHFVKEPVEKVVEMVEEAKQLIKFTNK